MKKDSEIGLRLRFSKIVDENIDFVRQKFINYTKNISPDLFMKIRKNHIQFTFQGDRQKYWSPHLSIELETKEGDEKNATLIRGLFGPAQTMWTFFIFLHFIIGGVLLVFSMFAYSNYILGKSIKTDLFLMILMLFCWILLYFIARQTRKKGYSQMEELEQEFNKIIS